MATKENKPTVESVSVMLDPKTRPGVRKCGPYKVGVTYEVTTAEAKALEKKGFKKVTATAESKE